MERERVIYPKRGDIYLVNFDPTIGSEINKTRPALIIQNNVSNRYSPVTIVAAITSSISTEKVYPTEVFLPAGTSGLQLDSLVLLNQIRTIDTQRLVKKLGSVTKAQLETVNRAIVVSLAVE